MSIGFPRCRGGCPDRFGAGRWSCRRLQPAAARSRLGRTRLPCRRYAARHRRRASCWSCRRSRRRRRSCAMLRERHGEALLWCLALGGWIRRAGRLGGAGARWPLVTVALMLLIWAVVRLGVAWASAATFVFAMTATTSFALHRGVPTPSAPTRASRRCGASSRC